MGVTDKMWDAITTVVRMNDKVERLSGAVKSQQEKIENLTGRLIRVETALEIAMTGKVVSKPVRRIEAKD